MSLHDILTATICPVAGDEAVTGRYLLDIAGDDVHLVATTMDGPGGVTFLTTDKIAEQYLINRYGPLESSTPVEENVNPPVKKRGRPVGSKNKTTVSSDEEK